MIEGWFCTSIYYQDLVEKDFQKAQEEIKQIVSNTQFSKREGWGDHNLSLSDPTFEENILVDYNAENFLNIIKENAKIYVTDLNGSCDYDIDVHASWITKTNKGEHGIPHAHGDYDIAGVYYFQTNGIDGSLKFINPNMAQVATKLRGTQYQHAEFPPTLGRLILFPGWLMHFVDENETDNERISVSFNILLRSKS